MILQLIFDYDLFQIILLQLKNIPDCLEARTLNSLNLSQLLSYLVIYMTLHPHLFLKIIGLVIDIKLQIEVKVFEELHNYYIVIALIAVLN